MTPPRKVLIIDDNTMNLELATNVLEAAGFVIVVADNAKDGIAIARVQQPALILLDIGLPGMDGYAALRTLKADPGTRGIPTVALTAFAMEEDKARAVAAGFDSFITKPIQTRTFSDAVRHVLDNPVSSR